MATVRNSHLRQQSSFNSTKCVCQVCVSGVSVCAEITASVYSNRPLLQTKHGPPLLCSGTSRTEVGSHPAAFAYGNEPAHMWDLRPPRRFLQDNHMLFYTPLLSVKCPVATVLRYRTGGLQSPPGLFSSSLSLPHVGFPWEPE